MTDVLDTIDRDLALVLRPIAKTGPKLPHAAANEPSRQRFVASVDALDAHGWSWERIARFLGHARTSVIAVYKGERYVPARWLDQLDLVPEIKALPTQLRAAQLRKVG